MCQVFSGRVIVLQPEKNFHGTWDKIHSAPAKLLSRKSLAVPHLVPFLSHLGQKTAFWGDFHAVLGVQLAPFLPLRRRFSLRSRFLTKSMWFFAGVVGLHSPGNRIYWLTLL